MSTDEDRKASGQARADTIDSESNKDEKIEAAATQVEDIAAKVAAGYQTADGGSRTGFRRLLKRNPSVEFINDLAKMNEEELDAAEVKKLERRISLLIVPALAVCYAFYYIDKTTLAYAAIFGIKKDLKLKNEEYSWLSSLFYFGWLAWGLPTNLLMQKFPLAKYLSINIMLWGVFLMAQAAVKSFAELAILRVISGALEATADPAFVLITSIWYTRKQQPTVIGFWYSANGIGIAFGGLLGYGIGQIRGTLEAWRYEFLIIGALCFGWGIIMWIFIPDSPYGTRWLPRKQQLIVMSRKKGEQAGVDNRRFRKEQAWEALFDIKTFLYFFLGFTANVPNGGTSNFGTLILNGFGFDVLQTTLMQIPYGCFIAVMIYIAIYVNHHQPKGYMTLLMAGVTVLTVIGFALMRWLPESNRAGRYIGYCLTGSSNAVFVLALSLISGNVGGSTKKSLSSAAIFIGVATGNIVGPFLFLESEAPAYQTGIVGCMVSRAIEILVILALRINFIAHNRHRDKKLAEGHSEYDPNVDVLEDVGDLKNMRFRYVA